MSKTSLEVVKAKACCRRVLRTRLDVRCDSAALLTAQIRNLWNHLLGRQHRHDIHSRRSLQLLVHQRARILKYLKREFGALRPLATLMNRRSHFTLNCL